MDKKNKKISSFFNFGVIRQETQHGCLPSLPGNWDKGIEIVYGKNVITLTNDPQVEQGTQVEERCPFLFFSIFVPF
jgi:hypothetical protein